MTNLNELTNKDLKKGFVSDEDPFLNQYVLVRTYSAGVFAGTLKARYGNKILLENCRRLWQWKTANNGISLSEIAVHGIDPKDSKICCLEPRKLVEDIEISPISDAAKKTIIEAKEYIYE